MQEPFRYVFDFPLPLLSVIFLRIPSLIRSALSEGQLAARCYFSAMESSKYARLKLLMEDDDLFIGRAPSHTTASHLATNIDVEMPAGVADTDTQASSVQDARNSVDGREAVVGIPEQASRSPTSMIETRDHQHPGDTNPQEPSPKAVGEAWSRIFVRGAVSTVPKDLGHLADPNETFCFFKVVRIYPYKFIKDELRETVSKNFFTDGKFWNEEWEM